LIDPSALMAVKKADGSITAWGGLRGTTPSGNGYTKIYSNGVAFAVIKADGTIATWGNGSVGLLSHPTP
jgi:hypothetical protein